MLIVTDKVRQEMQELIFDLNHHNPMISFKRDITIFIIIKLFQLYILVFLVSKHSYYLAVALLFFFFDMIEG
jgi:hypothetical protein